MMVNVGKIFHTWKKSWLDSLPRYSKGLVYLPTKLDSPKIPEVNLFSVPPLFLHPEDRFVGGKSSPAVKSAKKSSVLGGSSQLVGA